MSALQTDRLSSIGVRPNQNANVEQKVYDFSPLGTVATSSVILVALILSYCLVAWVTSAPPIHITSNRIRAHDDLRFATLLSLIIATSLAMARFVRLGDRRDLDAIRAVFGGGEASLIEFAKPVPEGGHLERATLIGVLVGVIACLTNETHGVAGVLAGSATALWFSLVITLLSVLFVRGIELTRVRRRLYRRLIDSNLEIELLRIDRLSVIGRAAARQAVSWFVVSAVGCLLLVGGAFSLVNLTILLACFAMGGWIFVSMMLRVHEKITATKSVELDRLFSQIAPLREKAIVDTDSALRLHTLLEYEKRIADAPEWPFDQTTLVRVAASALILTTPWFGQAIAGYFVERIGAAFH